MSRPASQFIRGEHTAGYSRYLVLGALGVVFGDIGTSPLYAIRECFLAHEQLSITHDNVLGILSLIFWVLILVISIKYVALMLRADNRGEGGNLALMALVVGRTRKRAPARPLFIFLGLVGTSLLFADAMITPAISVLSAVEGLQVESHLFHPVIIPLSLIILVLLYVGQHYGTARIGGIFGPIVLLWFMVLALIGLQSIWQTPAVLQALNPYYALGFFTNNGWLAFMVMGSVFLVVTGGEALYADMGHFGRVPIQIAWTFVALPSLLLNYFGQGALLLRAPEAASNLFYQTVPAWGVLPMVLLATMATIIASQATISGAFSVANSAIQLGYCPRLEVQQTSAKSIGQIYVPMVNWVFMLGTAALVLGFRNSSRLAAAYGVAVSTTMLATTLFLYFVTRRIWRWPRWLALTLLTPFLGIDAIFFTSNLLKIPAGGWMPVVVGVVIFTLMDTWKKGRDLLVHKVAEEHFSIELFLESLTGRNAPVRVIGTAVFLTARNAGIPRAMLHNMKHNKVLHETVILLTVDTERIPYMPPEERIEIEPVGGGLIRVTVNYGFLERPDLPRVLEETVTPHFRYDPMDTTFFLGRETILAGTAPSTLSLWRRQLFAVMSRNALSAARFFRLPPNRVVEVGYQVEI
ncbi:MAG TPA: potassium transporter Kup [Gammaproteobacteria bacterium]|nr:potassium transporter Kup [Gammaproteobacteria bacterium]